MRWFVFVIAVGLSRVASADDAHTEMAAALVAQADLHPIAVSLPKTAVAPRQAATPSAVKRGIVSHVTDNARAAANKVERQASNNSQALVHQAQAATSSAAGQAQAQAAKDRAGRNPRRR